MNTASHLLVWISGSKERVCGVCAECAIDKADVMEIIPLIVPDGPCAWCDEEDAADAELTACDQRSASL